MVVRLVPCGVRECKQAVIDRERDRQTETSNKNRKEEHRTEYNTYTPACSISISVFTKNWSSCPHFLYASDAFPALLWAYAMAACITLRSLKLIPPSPPRPLKALHGAPMYAYRCDREVKLRGLLAHNTPLPPKMNVLSASMLAHTQGWYLYCSK
jgi:hypothetical protein